MYGLETASATPIDVSLSAIGVGDEERRDELGGDVTPHGGCTLP